jgi:hypothetical protein
LKTKGDIPRAVKLARLLEKENIDACFGFTRPQSVILGLKRLFKPSLKTKTFASIHNSDNFLTYNREK